MRGVSDDSTLRLVTSLVITFSQLLFLKPFRFNNLLLSRHHFNLKKA